MDFANPFRAKTSYLELRLWVAVSSQELSSPSVDQLGLAGTSLCFVSGREDGERKIVCTSEWAGRLKIAPSTSPKQWGVIAVNRSILAVASLKLLPTPSLIFRSPCCPCLQNRHGEDGRHSRLCSLRIRSCCSQSPCCHHVH